MHKTPLSFLIGFFTLTFIATAIMFATRPHPPAPPSNKTAVAATTFPIYDLVRTIAGDSLDVKLILPPGASPHTFEPEPALAKSLQDVRVVYANGVNLDSWAQQLVPSSAPIVTLDRGITLRPAVEAIHDEGGEGEEDEGPTDPHYWLDPKNGLQMAKTIRDDLSARFPDKKAVFEKNASGLEARIMDADTKAKELLATIKNRNIITFHDAWYYFASAYDLSIVGTFEPTGGREPTPKYLAQLSEALTRSGTHTIFAETQSATEAIKSFAQDHDLVILELDDIGGLPGRASYPALILYNARIISQNE